MCGSRTLRGVCGRARSPWHRREQLPRTPRPAGRTPRRDDVSSSVKSDMMFGRPTRTKGTTSRTSEWPLRYSGSPTRRWYADISSRKKLQLHPLFFGHKRAPCVVRTAVRECDVRVRARRISKVFGIGERRARLGCPTSTSTSPRHRPIFLIARSTVSTLRWAAEVITGVPPTLTPRGGLMWPSKSSSSHDRWSGMLRSAHRW